MWTKKQIESHKISAEILEKIKNSAFRLIGVNKNIKERQVSDFILKEFKKLGLKRDKDAPMVAFGKNTDSPHYFAKAKPKKLSKNSVILIDLWAKQRQKGSPFADITWMGYYGNKIPKRLDEIYKLNIKARDKAIQFIRTSLKKGKIPTGIEIDEASRGYISKKGFGKCFKHGTGHPLGFYSPHGNRGNIRKSNKKPLLINMGYTIEPGIYLKGKFGVRHELDFYIDKNLKLIITTPIQKSWIRIN